MAKEVDCFHANVLGIIGSACCWVVSKCSLFFAGVLCSLFSEKNRVSEFPGDFFNARAVGWGISVASVVFNIVRDDDRSVFREVGVNVVLFDCRFQIVYGECSFEANNWLVGW